ncbi:hypothetical protein Goshw_020675, partial [Gossypium schwendimanii]|nr:hypothetical protein [Gossypium schwendimanii]
MDYIHCFRKSFQCASSLMMKRNWLKCASNVCLTNS